MHIQLNGEEEEVSVENLQQLVLALGLEVRTIAIELNREVVPKSSWTTTAIHEGDRIEVVHMIGGG